MCSSDLIGQAFQLRVDMFDVARMKAHRLAVNLSGETAGVGAPVHQLIEGDIQRSLFHPQVQRVVDVDDTLQSLDALGLRELKRTPGD